LKTLRIPRFRPYFSIRILYGILTKFCRGEVLSGDSIEKFENQFAEYIGRKHAISVSSGRMALYLSLMAIDIKENEGIILPAFTVPEVVAIIKCAKAIPRFVDIDPTTYNMDPEEILKNSGNNVRAILITHLYGKPCAVDQILKIAEDNNLDVIEDAAQALGAEFKNKKIGTIGRMSYFSFGMVKNMNTLGGGMLVTDDDELASTVRKYTENFPHSDFFLLIKKFFLCLSLWILTKPAVYSLTLFPILYIFNILGRISLVDRLFEEKEIKMTKIPNSYRKKFSNLQATIGLEQLKTLDYLNEKRIYNARLLKSQIANIKELEMPLDTTEGKDIYLNLMVQSAARNEILSNLLRRGIDTTKGYLDDCSSMEAFKEFSRNCPEAKLLADRGFYLPVNPFLKRKDIFFISNTLIDILGSIKENEIKKKNIIC